MRLVGTWVSVENGSRQMVQNPLVCVRLMSRSGFWEIWGMGLFEVQVLPK